MLTFTFGVWFQCEFCWSTPVQHDGDMDDAVPWSLGEAGTVSSRSQNGDQWDELKVFPENKVGRHILGRGDSKNKNKCLKCLWMLALLWYFPQVSFFNPESVGCSRYSFLLLVEAGRSSERGSDYLLLPWEWLQRFSQTHGDCLKMSWPYTPNSSAKLQYQQGLPWG